MIAPNALTNTYGGGSTIGHTLFSDAQRAPVAGSFSSGGHGGPITCELSAPGRDGGGGRMDP